MKALRRVCIFALFLFLFPLSVLGAEKKENGMVRVLLTHPKLTNTAVIRLCGSYSMNGICFDQDEEITVRSSSGHLYVYYEGMSMDCGSSLILTRHGGNELTGFRLNGSRYLHPGSLHIQAEGDQMKAVLHAPIEEYLLGVVPYEMSDSFPLEALKCQAIASRTYALSNLSSERSDYDLTDNTSSQTYYGILSEKTRSATAIQETEGMICTYRGKPILCYYTASNGGVTEVAQHVWGGNGYPYLRSIQDPWDLANPNSLSASFVIPKQIRNPSDLGALYPLLSAETRLVMDKMNLVCTQDVPDIVEVRSVTLTEPAYSDINTGVYKKIQFVLGVKTSEIHADDDEEIWLFIEPDKESYESTRSSSHSYNVLREIKVVLPVFPDLETVMNADINSGNNEVYHITEEADRFVISAGRYGHGVGMSQRGAQQMALSGLSFLDILSFYYPSSTIEKGNFSVITASPLPPQLLFTPGPSASPTPRPTPFPLTRTPSPNEFVVIVDGIQQNSSLNLRSAAGTNSVVLRVLYYGQKLIVTGETEDWYQVLCGDDKGYVMKKYVSIADPDLTDPF